MATNPGILWVSSAILSPTSLSTSTFDSWYEDDHAPEVLSLSGVASAIRYKALSPTTTPHPHLITYEFPDLGYTSHPDFLAVANQNPPPELVEKIYANTAFDIRFYAELPTPSPPPHLSPSDPGAEFHLASIELSPVAGKEAEFLLWFAKELAEGLGSVNGFVRLRRFEFVNGVKRERNVVSVPERRRYLVLAKFECGEGGVEDVRGEVEGCVGKEGLVEAEVEWFGVRKVWVEGEIAGAEGVEEP